LYFAVLLIGVLLSLKGRWLLIPGVSFAAAGLLGLSGVVANIVQPRFYPMFSYAFISLIPAAIFVVIAFILFPQLVLRN
jgi:hypothetical protein